VSAAPNPAATEVRTPSAADHLQRGASPCQPHPTQQRGSNAVGCRSPLRGAAHRRVSRPQPGSEARTPSAADHLRGAAHRRVLSAAPNPAATEARTPSAADHLRRGASPCFSRTQPSSEGLTLSRLPRSLQRGASPCPPHPTHSSEARTPSAADHLSGAAHRRVRRTQPTAARLERRRLPIT
jgi:hypothetical protein